MEQSNINTYDWKDLHTHYTNIKKTYNLTSSDIIKQLNSNSKYCYLDYLSPSGYHREPAKRIGTMGRTLRDLLIENIHKTDWSPSTATYKDKLDELNIEIGMMINAYMTNEDYNNPELDITINLDQTRKHSKEELEQRFTIDGIVPRVNISYSRYLINAGKLCAEFGITP